MTISNQLPEIKEKINVHVKRHETKLKDKDWVVRISESQELDLKSLSTWLYKFFDLFNVEFFASQLPLPVITFKNSSVRNLGHFRHGRNDIGALYEININITNIDRPLMLILSTLLHEMGHQAQYIFPDIYGSPSSNGFYHNKKFQELSTIQGIPCSQYGVILEIKDPFRSFCVKHGVEDASYTIDMPADIEVKGKSKLRKWVCDCGYGVRVARSRFNALCLDCKQKFRLAE